MERHPETLAGEGVVRRHGKVTPFNAADALAIVLDEYGQPVPRQHKARLGKAAKELLEDGFDPQTVCRALLIAVYRARVDLAPTIALELQSAVGGKYLGWKRYQADLESLSRRSRPEDAIRRALREEFSR